jgi:hypothetical protein
MAQVKEVLVVYGVPPNRILLFTLHGKNLHKEWKFDAKTFGGAQRRAAPAEPVNENETAPVRV